MKNKCSIGITGIIVTILITIAVTILAGWLIYEFYIKDDSVSSEDSVQNNQNLYSTNEMNLNETASESTVENVDDNYDAQSITKFKMNGKDVEVIIGCVYSQDSEEADIITQKCVIKVNDVISTGIEGISTYNNQPMFYNIPEISLIKGTDNKEYIVLKTFKYLPTGGPITNIYIINEEGENLGKITDNGYSLYVVHKNSDGKEFNEKLELQVNSQAIIGYKFVEGSSGVQKHKYTISNNKIEDTVVETISNVQSAGK